jgi:hypothetical protein
MLHHFTFICFFVLVGSVRAFLLPARTAGSVGTLPDSANSRPLHAWHLFAAGTSEPPAFPESSSRTTAAVFFSNAFFYDDAKSAKEDTSIRKAVFGKTRALAFLTGVEKIIDWKGSKIDTATFDSYTEDYRNKNDPLQDKKTKPSSTGLVEEDATFALPKYKPWEKATKVFSNLAFYDGDKDVANACAKRRSKALKDKKVGTIAAELFAGIYTYDKLAAWLLIQPSIIIAFFAQADIEKRLQGKIIALNATVKGEVERYDRRFVPVSTTQSLFVGKLGAEERDLPLCFVWGPSGSGKTFASLHYCAKEVFREQSYVTVYLQPGETKLAQGMPSDADTCKNLVDWIKQRIEKHVQAKIDRLDMSVCVIIDEAKTWGEFFEDKMNLQDIIDGLKEQLTERVFLVICGVEVTGINFDSKKSVFKIQIGQWKQSDFLAIVKDTRNLIPEDRNEFANAIFAQPTLNALTTNARSAGFVVDTVVELSKGVNEAIAWRFRVNEWASAIVSRVVARYKRSNGIAKLPFEKRAVVAAWLFYSLGETKPGILKLPGFFGLPLLLRNVAKSLLFVNLEVVKIDEKNTIFTFANKETFAVSVSPALGVVIYSLAGVEAGITVGWESQESITILYAVRQWILARFRDHRKKVIGPLLESWGIIKNGKEYKDLERSLSLEPESEYTNQCERAAAELAAVLGKLSVVRLGTQIQALPGCDIFIPKVSSSHILQNAGKSSFADVMARYFLGQSKHITFKKLGTKMDYTVVEMIDEMKKCGLLKNSDPRQCALLLAWEVVWRGDFNEAVPVFSQDAPKKNTGIVSMSKLQDSKAFPENCFDTPVSDGVQYLNVTEVNGEWGIVDGEKWIELPSDLSHDVDFVISTNARQARLSVGPGKNIHISANSLNDDGTLRLPLEDSKDDSLWRNFLSTVRSKIKIKFVFTRGIQTPDSVGDM